VMRCVLRGRELLRGVGNAIREDRPAVTGRERHPAMGGAFGAGSTEGQVETYGTPGSAARCNKLASPAAEQTGEVVRNDEVGAVRGSSTSARSDGNIVEEPHAAG